jgi:hypothetical protein
VARAEALSSCATPIPLAEVTATGWNAGVLVDTALLAV